MSDELATFVASAARRRFQFGIWDCGRFTAAWVQIRRGVDPGAEWRGRYRSARELARIIKRRGGMVAHFDACLAPLGIARTESPKRGDIAIVDTLQGETGAIVLGNTVAMLKGPGIITRHRSAAPILAAWSI